MFLFVGFIVVLVPTFFACRVLWHLSRQLGAIDGELLANALKKTPVLSVQQLYFLIKSNTHLQKSIVFRVLESVQLERVDSNTFSMNQQIALAEMVSQLEREIVEHTRTPRIAASLATSAGLLSATLVMRKGLAFSSIANEPLSLFQGVMEQGLTLVVVALFGGLMCALIHKYAKQERQRRLRELDAMVEWLLLKLQ